MSMSLFQSKMFWFCTVVFMGIAGVFGINVYKSKSPQEPVIIYKTTHPSAAVKSPEMPAKTQKNPVSVDQAEPIGEPVDSFEPPPLEAEPVEADVPISTPDDSSEGATVTNSDETEKLYFGDYTEEDFIKIREWATELYEKQNAEFPDIMELSGMTPEEIAEKYPTDSDRLQLAKRGQDFFDFYSEELGALLSVLPETLRSEVINNLRAQFAQNWGSERADQLVADTLQRLQ